ncbi:hypothetical protein NW754_005663 [Fusarium falciforme]|uniref:Lysine-specific metallo-endopeptidase domain-containing protein n=1 Tax=Fusarium falciforme TaxID=195108 RepID=A0A9W8UXN0_9HYPO|nr:Hypothetical protein NCS54_00862500 [Fusarium falciforme]KAJ4175243.1 hypothetical protein NW754_005663 [Fusarium falciforme]KAJ4185175.1 hypothetical protein NW755_008619 [Fusarium falciforme]KAJ4240306.1 hypothetical protein NW757_012589 [Fusarium falciforme]WAO91168.1 Hypothetical protein NCS54_00862500 [Fusarium falciforme]
MMLKKLLLFFGLLQAVIGQERRVYIDTVSCSNQRTFDAIKEAYQSAIIRAGLAIDALRPWAQEGASIDTFDGRIRNVFDLLFGAGGTRTKVSYVFGHLDRLLEVQYMNDLMTGGQWSTARTMHDIEIHCNADYIQPHPHPKEPNIHHEDTIQKKPVHDDDAILGLKNPFKSAFAVTSPVSPPSGKGWDQDAPEIVAYSPWKLYFAANWDGFPGNDVVFGGIKINQAAVEAAANPRMHRWFLTNAPEWLAKYAWAPIDLLDRLESTMLHELTHTTAGRLTQDVELPNSYGWKNCVRLKKHSNADSIALFALAVELINFYHYDVNEAGELTKIE